MARSSARTPLAERTRQRGIVLVAVLWIVAALVLLVSGMSYLVQVDVRSASSFRAEVEGQALADGAAMLAARDLLSAEKPATAVMTRQYLIDGRVVVAEIAPASGWIDINSAPVGLLKALFEVRAGLPPERAARLAAAVVDWRDPDHAVQPNGAEADEYASAGTAYRPRNDRFQAPEDLLQVLGMNFDVFDSIRDCITVAATGQGGVNAQAAPASVLSVLAHGDDRTVSRVLGRRAGDDPLQDLSGLDDTFLGGGQATAFRVFARIPRPDGSALTGAVWLRMERSGGAKRPVEILYRDPVHFSK